MSSHDDAWQDEESTLGLPAFQGLPIGRRVLVAEDDPAMRDLLETVLSQRGYQVATVGNGSELTTLLGHTRAEERFDLIVSDVRMPGISGLDVIDRLREAGDTTPVVIVTAFPQGDVVERARGLEVRLLSKPFDLETLRVAVDWAIRSNAPRRARLEWSP
jgi:DNA-binding response OmpR family regulator